MTTRRDFLRGSAALVTGAVALEAYERLTWTRRFWSGWQEPRPTDADYLARLLDIDTRVARIILGAQRAWLTTG